MLFDEIINGNRGGTRNSCHAMYKHISLFEVTIEELVCLAEMNRDCLVCDVFDIYVEMFYRFWEGKWITAD